MANRTCTLPGCGRAYRARGLCMHHYNKWKYYGNADVAGVAPSKACAHCGCDIPPKAETGPPPTYCSKACRSRASHARRSDAKSARRRAKVRESRAEKRCPCCGDTFTPELTARQKFCSRRCSRRMQNAGRRAKLRESFVEPLHWRQLFDEDGAECHLCGLATDPDDFALSERGWRALGPSYPTLDHVVPLSAGGMHERANARLAHFYCNTVKGAKPLAEVA